MKRFLILLLVLVACNMGEVAKPDSGPVWAPEPLPTGESKEPSINDSVSAALYLIDAGVDSSDTSFHSGEDASCDAAPDADPIDPPVCETGTAVVGHCLFNMATACQEYFSDHSADCSDLVVHPMGGTWWAGPCGGEKGTDLSRSIGGCKDECGSIHWAYRLGGGPPDDVSIQSWKDSCEAFPGRTYVPIP